MQCQRFRYPLRAGGHADLRRFLARLAALLALAGWGRPVPVYVGLARARPEFGRAAWNRPRWVEHINRAYASLFTSFVAHTNRVGFEDGLNFWGGSTVYDPNGDLLASRRRIQEDLTLAEIDLNQLHRTAPACRCCATSAPAWCSAR